MKAKKSLKKRFITAGLLFIGVCCLVLTSAYFYIQSNHFKERVEIALSDLTGDQIEIVGQLTLVQMIPLIELDLPAIKIRSANLASGFERLRADDIGVVLPTKMLFSGVKNGSIELNLAKISVVARRAVASDSEEDADTTSQIIDNFRSSYPALEVSAKIGHIDYIVRDGKIQHFELDELAAKINTDALSVTGQYPQGETNTDQFSFQLNDLSSPGPATNERLKAKLLLSITPYRDFQGDKDASVNVSATVEIHGNEVGFTDVDYKSADVWARGNLRVDPSNGKTKIEADIELRQLEVASLFSTNGEKSVSPQKLFNRDPLNLKIFDQVEVDAQVYMGAVRYNNEPFINGQIKLEVIDGQLLLNSENLTLLGGDSVLSLSAKRLQKDVEFRMKLTSEDLHLDRIRVDRSNAAVLERGTGDVIVALQGTGASTAGIAGSLNGYVIAAVSDAFLKRKYVSLIDQGIVSWARNKILFMSQKQKPETVVAKESRGLQLDCASLRLFINDGRVEVTNGAVIELPHNTLVSSGYIDLRSEELGFVVRTKSESLFDWSAISIIEYLEVGGSLTKPGFGLDLGTLAKQGVLSTASFLYGPLPSLVYSLAEAGLQGREDIRCIPEIN